jgi:hypothetical protein
MEKNNLSSISEADTYEKIGEFWDSHDFTEYDDENMPDANFEISCTISVEPDLLSSIEKHAGIRKIDTETLVNLWLYEKLNEINSAV